VIPVTPESGEVVPRLSVIVPTYQRSAILGRCLEALTRQTCDSGSFEVVVCDDGSFDDTNRVTAAFAERDTHAIRYIYQPNSGANSARNKGIQAARGHVLLFINDDTIPSETMLEEHLAYHLRYSDDRVAVLGRVTVSPRLPPSRLGPLHLDRAFRRLNPGAEYDWRCFFTCNISVKKSLLQRGGVFEESIRYHEDLELSERLSHHGLRVIYNAAALGYHDHYLTESEFVAIAKREADSLALWARKAPHVAPLLGSLGYETAMPAAIRWKHRAADFIVNPITIPALLFFARNIPQSFRVVYESLYLQVYQSTKRTALARAEKTIRS
jgi:glycosyltransferase involved in cell wall biosynthesis